MYPVSVFIGEAHGVERRVILAALHAHEGILRVVERHLILDLALRGVRDIDRDAVVACGRQGKRKEFRRLCLRISL